MTGTDRGAYVPLRQQAEDILFTQCDGCTACQQRAKAVADAYLDLQAQVAVVLDWIANTGCTCPVDYQYASLPDHENECPAQVEHLLTTTSKDEGPS